MLNHAYRVRYSKYISVKNIHGTSDSPLPDGYTSWKNFWEDKTGRNFEDCSKKLCTREAEVGAHVKKASAGSGNEWYIVPLCKICNMLEDPFEVEEDDLVAIYD